MTYRASDRAPSRRRGIHSEVVSELGARIVRGHYSSAGVLPKADVLADELGVSRTVVREATRVLAEKGLVESRQRAGTRVRERLEWDLMDGEVIAWQRLTGPDVGFLRDLTEVRMAIETMAAHLAAQRATTTQVQHMREYLDQMAEDVDDPTEYVRVDLLLHDEIFRAAANPLLIQLERSISEGLVASRDITIKVPGSRVRALPLHLEVIESIAARDPDAAGARMSRLLQGALADIETIMGRSEAGVTPVKAP